MVCFLIALPAWLLGKIFPLFGSAVLALIMGMLLTIFWKEHGNAAEGINWTSKIYLTDNLRCRLYACHLCIYFPRTGKFIHTLLYQLRYLPTGQRQHL